MYILKATGDRLYNEESVKIRIGLVDRLKKMNETYRKNSVDYDAHFLAHLMHSLFDKEEIKKCVDTRLINHFSIVKMKLVKCNS